MIRCFLLYQIHNLLVQTLCLQIKSLTNAESLYLQDFRQKTFIMYNVAQRLRPCLHSCGAQNLLRLGAPINFDRCATTVCAVSPTGSAWQLCSGNPLVAIESIAHSTKRKPPKLGGFILWLRGQDSNLRPPGYEPDELPTALPRDICALYF